MLNDSLKPFIPHEPVKQLSNVVISGQTVQQNMFLSENFRHVSTSDGLLAAC